MQGAAGVSFEVGIKASLTKKVILELNPRKGATWTPFPAECPVQRS